MEKRRDDYDYYGENIEGDSEEEKYQHQSMKKHEGVVSGEHIVELSDGKKKSNKKGK